MAQKKYVSLNRLSDFLNNIKTIYSQIGHKHTLSDLTDYKIDTSLSSTSTNPVQNNVLDTEFKSIDTAMDALELAISGKADSSHSHNDIYYTDDEIDTKLSDKADKTHEHEIDDINGLTTTLANKADKHHGTHVVYLVEDPLMDGEADCGFKNEVARADHRHPTDTSRASKVDLDSHSGDTTIHVTKTERTNWNAAKTHADSAHAPSNAEKNQNAFSNVMVGDTTITADTATDTLELIGSGGIKIMPNATDDKITLTVNNALLGQGRGVCYTQTATAEKEVGLYNYSLAEGGVVSVQFTYSVKASATMNVNNTGAKAIYYRGSAIADNVIIGGDVATFIYDGSRYHLLSVDRWHEDIVNLRANDRMVRQILAEANSNYPLLLANYFQSQTTTGYAYFDSGVYLNPSTNTITANISGTATGLKNLDATIGELNHMMGVKSSVQTQLDNKSQVQIVTWEAND